MRAVTGRHHPQHPNWIRVSRRMPCPICGKPDWCGVHADGTAAICSRATNGHPVANRTTGEVVGYLYKLGDGQPHRRMYIPPALKRAAAQDPATQRHLEATALRYATQVSPEKFERFSKSLGLDPAHLRRLRVGRNPDRDLWTFPMADGAGRIIGVRVREGATGKKWSFDGSQNGLFVPTDLTGDGPLLVPEGPTSCCACLQLGFDAVGRPNNNAGASHLIDWLRANGGRRRSVIILGDRDRATLKTGQVLHPGEDGAQAVARAVALARDAAGEVRWMLPPGGVKDAREWLNHPAAPATRRLVEILIGAAPIVVA